MSPITAWSEDNLSSTAFRQRMSFDDTQIETYPRWALNTATLGNGTAYVTTFTPTTSKTISSLIVVCSGGNSDTGGTTVRRLGLYTVSGTTATLVARTASDTTLGSTSSTVYTLALNTTGGYPATYNIVAGTTYGFGWIFYNTGGTFASPSMVIHNSGGSAVHTLAPRLVFTSGSQSDLPTSITQTGASSAIIPYGRLA